MRVGGVERLEIPDLALAEDEDAAAAQVGVEPREREPGLLRVRNGDVAVEAVGAGQQLEVERARSARSRSTVATVTPGGGLDPVNAASPAADLDGCHGQSGSINP